MPAEDYATIYPTTLPTACITKLIAIVRAGQVVERKDELGLAAYNVQGYLQRVTLGVPADAEEGVFGGGAGVAAGGASPQLEAADADQLETACRSAVEQLNEPNGTRFASGAAKAIDPAMLVALFNMVLELIKLWRAGS